MFPKYKIKVNQFGEAIILKRKFYIFYSKYEFSLWFILSPRWRKFSNMNKVNLNGVFQSREAAEIYIEKLKRIDIDFEIKARKNFS